MRLRLLTLAALAVALFVAAPAFASSMHLTTGYAPGCGDSGGGTASGTRTGWGTAAVSLRQYHFGQRFYVPGYGYAVARDTGGAVGPGHIDLWFPTCSQARAWGTRYVRIRVL